MDTEDESAAYMKLLNEGPHNYLLHSGEDGLNDAFPVESIFTEIASDWTSEGFPILLSGPLITENNDSDLANASAHKSEDSPKGEDASTDNTVTFYSNGQKNKFIFSNDVLLRVQEADAVTHVYNSDNITYAQNRQNAVVKGSNENVEVIQLLNIDGTVTTINKNLLQAINGKDRTPAIENFYTQIEANKCKLCSFLCESVEDIIAHIKIKHVEEVKKNNYSTQVKNGQRVERKMTSILNVNKEKKKYVLYVCSSCGKGYSDKEDLRRHMILHHQMVQTIPAPVPTTLEQPSPAKPPPVENEQKQKSVLRMLAANLIKKQKSLRKFKCSINGCILRFDKKESCKKHEDCHVDKNKRQFMCPVCKAKFSIWRICCMHMWKTHSVDLGLLTCPMCNQFKSYSAGRVINHMAIHNEEKPFICSSCGKHFKQLNQLHFHEISHKSPEELPNSFTKKRCDICDRIFANSKCLKKHIKFVHDKFKPFICNICGHQTARKEMLQLHYRQHTGDKPFSCSCCDYKTADRNCLRRHMMRHFGIAKYLCPYCSYQSIQSTAYKVHLTNKHPEKEGIYACSICKYITINLNAYLSHVKCHEQEQKKNKINLKIEKRTVEDSESKSSDETQNFLNNEHSEEVVDTGGITIPASFDLQLPSEQTTLI